MSDKPKILIIDDDTNFANDLKNCLISGSYNVLPIKDNAKDGIDSINKYHPDGVVLDIQLKGGLGLDVLNYLKPEQSSELDPVLITVSSYINNRIAALLNKKKCLFFDKSYNYKHELVLNYFNDMIMIDIQREELALAEHKDDDTKLPISKTQLTDEQIKHLIHKKLDSMGFDSKVTAYHYLVNAIHYIIDPKQVQAVSLTKIFKETTYVQYSSAFNGVKRLILNTFKQNGLNSGHSLPSVKEFIYRVVDEIKEDHFN